MNTAARNIAIVRETAIAGRALTFVHSYPRSGNTWMRFLLSDIHLQACGFETATELPVHPDLIIPDIYSNPIEARHPSAGQRGLTVKTHEPLSRIKALLGGRIPESAKILCLFRRPEDALISHYHFHLRYPELRAEAAAGADAFCLSRLDAWLEHASSHLEELGNGAPVKLIAYETMLAQPENALRDALAWLEWPVDELAIEKAVSHMAFAKLRKREERQPLNTTEFFFRKGVQGSGRNELSEAAFAEIQDRSSATYERLQEAEQSLDSMRRAWAPWSPPLDRPLSSAAVAS